MTVTRVRSRPAALALAIALVAGACATTSTTPTPNVQGSAVPSTAATSPVVASSPRPIVVDTDLAADDILAIMVLLRDPAVDVRGIAVDGTGEVRCPAGLRNARRLVAAFGRSDIPVACGSETPGPNGRWFPSEWRDGADAFYGIALPEVDGESTRTGEQAPQLLARLAAAARTEGTPLTVVALGPWTNLADALDADPAFTSNLAGIHAMGGTIDAPGNIDIDTTSPSDMVEWNFGVDPDALAAVMATDVPVTMVGLDATNHVPVPNDIAETLGTDTAAAGANVAHEMYLRNPFLIQGSSFWDTLAAAVLSDPSIATWQDLSLRVDTAGRSAGRVERDPAGRPVHAAMNADQGAFMTAFLAALRRGAPRPAGGGIAGTLTASWDGRQCAVTKTPAEAGDALVTFENRSAGEAALQLARAVEPHTWADAIAWAKRADFSDPNLKPPAWIVPVGAAQAEAGGSGTTVVTLDAGTFGAVCGVGTYPRITFNDGGTFEVKATP
jgi:pyrimidine-specific ribonucleoside hydrolase